MPSSSKVPLAGQAPTQSFSAMIERATPSPSELFGTHQNPSQGLAQKDHAPVGSPPKGEVKSSDFKTSGFKPSDFTTGELQGQKSTASRALLPGSDASEKAATVLANQPTLPPALSWNTAVTGFTPNAITAGAVPSDQGPPSSASEAGTSLNPSAVVIQPMLSPALSWNEGINSSALTPLVNGVAPTDRAMPSSASAADANVSPDSTGGSTFPPTVSEGIVQGTGIAIQDAPIGGSANPSDAETVASLGTNPSGAPVLASTAQFGNTSLPSISLRNASHGPVEMADDVHKPKAAVASELEQVGTLPGPVPPTSIPPIPTPDHGKMDSGSTKGTRDKTATDKSRVSNTQDSLGTTGKNAEITGSENAQPGRNWAPSFAIAPATDQNADSAPASIINLAPSFSITGTQSSSIVADGKSASEAGPSGTSDQPAGKLENSTGVAEAPTPGEPAAGYPTSLVQSAKLVQRIGESELRLGIRAGEFGSVDIRTSMVRNQFTAEISVERGELGRVMAAELPSLQSRLTEQGVPVASVTVQHHTGSPSTASDQQNPRGGQQQYAANLASAREEGPTPALVPFDGTAPASRLDIHM